MFSYPSVLTYFLAAQKNHLIETVLLSTHNICFGREIGKLIFWYVHLTKCLQYTCIFSNSFSLLTMDYICYLHADDLAC